MMRSSLVEKSILASLAVFVCFTAIRAQADGVWKRATTGEDHIVDIDAASLFFYPDGVVSARFRTVLSKPEPLVNDSKAKYKTRLETIEFRSAGRGYRSANVSLVDTGGKTIVSRTEPGGWKKSGLSARKWFEVIKTQQPFGQWKVMSYRLLDVATKSSSDALDLDRLVGSDIFLGFDSVSVGKKQCQLPSYESRKLREVDLEKFLGVSITNLGLAGAPVDVVAMKCGTNDWPPGQSLLVAVHPSKMLFLWEGAFFELIPAGVKQFPIPFTVHDIRDKTLIVTSP